MPFAPEYVTLVLDENFEDAKAQFLAPLMAIHYAHLVMLARQGIVAPGDARALRDALDAIPLAEVQSARFDGKYEDLFFYVDGLIAQQCGEEIAGRLHTARSRNDIDMAMYRMRQRELILALAASALALRRSLLEVADRHRETVLVVHTHTQRAQPTTVAHYLLAMVEQLERDGERLKAAYGRTDRCPMGACAITGTGFPIDRALTAELLGFAAPTGNTYGSIATADYLLESASASSVLLVGLGRFVQDLLLWGTAEMNYLRFGDGFVQCSSIMPQKRNPVAVEHARALGSKAFGQALAIVISVHNTPFGDIVDTEDDLQPLVFSMFRDACRAVRLVAAAMTTVQFDPVALESRAAGGWATITELADTLVREQGVSFGAAHAIAVRLIAAHDREPARPLAALLAEACREVAGTAFDYSEARVADLLSPRRFVEVRRTPGGPAPEETARAVAASRELLDADEGWHAATAAVLAAAARRLKERSAEL
jgi:argininosuccinate lyase